VGIVQKRSFQSSFFLVVGILLGFLTSGILLPNYFSEEENGLITLLNSYSLLYSQIAIMGIHSVVIRFYPHFRDETSKHNNFLTTMSVVVFGSFLLFTGYYYFTKPFFKTIFEKSPLFEQNYFYLLPLTFFTLYFYLFDAYSTAQTKTVRGFILKDVLQRVFILLAIGAYIVWQTGLGAFILLYNVAMCLPTILFFIILFWENQFSFRVDVNDMYRRNWRYMAKVSGYSMLLGISSVGISNMDAILIERMLDIKQAGIYGRNMFFGALVAVPYRTIHKIASGLLSGAFKEGDMGAIKSIYYKSTITQLILGCFIFTGIWLNIHNVYQIIPESYAGGKYVIFFIGLGNLFTMLGGVNTAVISYSPYYRWNTIFLVILLALVVVTNILLIPLWGISGAALATAFSIFLYNAMMYIFLWVRYRFQPFDYRHALVILIMAGTYFVAWLIPAMPGFILDIAVRSTVFTVLFGVLILISRVSPDVNNMARFLWRKAAALAGRRKDQ